MPLSEFPLSYGIKVLAWFKLYLSRLKSYFFYFFNDITEALECNWLLITSVYSVKHIGLKIFESETVINKQNIHLREDKRKCILLIRKCKLKNFGNSKHAQAFNVAELSFYQRKAIIKSNVHQKPQTLTQNLLQRFQINA